MRPPRAEGAGNRRTVDNFRMRRTDGARIKSRLAGYVGNVAKWVHLFRNRRRFGVGVGRLRLPGGRPFAVCIGDACGRRTRGSWTTPYGALGGAAARCAVCL